MPRTNRVDLRARALKDFFHTTHKEPQQAKQFRLAQREVLHKLESAVTIVSETRTSVPDEHVRQVTQAFLFSILVPELMRAEPEANLADGLALFWQSYIQSIASTRATPSLDRVLRYCADRENLRDLEREAQRWARAAYAQEPARLQMVLSRLKPETFRKQVLSGLPQHPDDSMRRTYGNYLNLAAREIALRMEAIVPGLFSDEDAAASGIVAPVTPYNAASVPQMETEQGITAGKSAPFVFAALTEMMLEQCATLTVVGGRPIRVAQRIPLELEKETLRGEPVLPNDRAVEQGNLQGMSGFLSGVLGSGRSAWMRHMAWRFAEAWRKSADGPLAFYFSVRDFGLYARNRRSIYEFIADRLCAGGYLPEQTAEGLAELRGLDRAGKLLLLADDLDSLSETEQGEVMAQLVFSPAVIWSALPWQVNRLRTLDPRSHFGLFRLLPVPVAQYWDFVSVMLSEERDIPCAMELLQTLPDLASSPLGITTILQQVASGEGELTRVVEYGLDEFLRRAGLPPRPHKVQATPLSPEWEDLLCYADRLRLICLRPDSQWLDRSLRDVVIPRIRFERSREDARVPTWEQMVRTGLFEPISYVHGEGLRLIHRDLSCYLMAFAPWWNDGLFRAPSVPIPPETRKLLERAEAHWLVLNQRSPTKRWQELEQARVDAEQAARDLPGHKQWRRLPELFRHFS